MAKKRAGTPRSVPIHHQPQHPKKRTTPGKIDPKAVIGAALVAAALMLLKYLLNN